ncbi:hypothetical protein O7606_17220 [Micromonospora sp. WMMD882]|uniref:hypothetical protein n=1 Tax=Micromonospora sp. WMMD882 TaxID=3015151 RepID=UPI00248BA54E|nr:hypothetical protein [Micromonospora sp. WMMD882]WBB77990.1 hypothetical protein O7606_17220 [Micromonospora sp. WMMD882]
MPPAPPTPATGTPASGAPATGARPTGTAGVGVGSVGTPNRSGTIYGGSVTEGPGFATVAFPAGNPVENTGSLTGHILAQGWADAPAERSSTTKVVLVLVALLGLLVAISLVVVLMANDALGGLFQNLIGG